MPGVASPRPGRLFAARWQTDAGEHVTTLQWHPHSGVVVAGTAAGDLLVAGGTRGASILRIAAHAHGLRSLSCRPNAAWVATGGQDGMVRVWDLDTGSLVHEHAAGAAWVERVAWSPGGDWLACAAGKGVRIWTMAGRLVREFPTHRATVTDIQWHPRRAQFCSTSYGGVTLFDPERDAPLQTLSWQGSSLVAAWSPDGRYIATGDQDSTVHFWVVDSGDDLMMSGYARKVRELSWDERGRWLATGGGPEVTVWNTAGDGPAGTRPVTLPGHDAPVTAVAFQPRGAWLASGGADGRVVIWHPGHTRKLVGAWASSHPVSQLAWAGGGRELFVGAADGRLTCLAIDPPRAVPAH